MRLSSSALQVDFYPVGTGKRFVQRVVWHPGAETEMTSFRTIHQVRSPLRYQQPIANDAEVVDFNTEAYQAATTALSSVKVCNNLDPVVRALI